VGSDGTGREGYSSLLGLKEPYLVAYDYGQGAVWAYVTAESAKQIKDQFPDFKVFETRPDWMTEDDARDIAKGMSFDLDRPTGWLASVIELRNKR
jgi:hypothetical protein